MRIREIALKTGSKVEFTDISVYIRDFIISEGITDGRITIFIPHTTAAVTINENADSDVLHDLLMALDKAAPALPGFQHREGNSDAHFRSSLFGCSQELLVYEGKLILGTWQSVYFCEFDGPRQRKFIISC